MRAFLRIFTPGRRLAAFLPGLAIALLPLCTTAGAQEQGAQPARQASGGRPHGRAPGANLMRRLNLTPEQRLRLREIRRQNEPAARELTRRMRLARRALDEAIYADAFDQALVEQRTRELSAAQAELVRLRAATELSVRRVLTPEQLQSFRELRREAQRRQSLRRWRGGADRQRRGAPFQNPPGAEAPAESPDPRREDPPPPRRSRP